MALYIQTNVASLQAQINLNKSQTSLSSSFNRLSSGYRVNSAKDDAAGLAISESMNHQVKAYTVAERNANDAISMAQTAEGALGQISGILGRMRELATQGASGALTSSDRSYISTEFTQLQAEVSRIATSTKFNGRQLIQASSSAIAFQVGIKNVSTDRITVTFGAVALATLASTTNTKVSGSAGNSQTALDTIENTLTNVSTARARFGAAMNRLNVSVNNIQTMGNNLSAANSRIRDVDVASETSALSKNQVLSQAGAAVLAQANQAPQLALTLLR